MYYELNALLFIMDSCLLTFTNHLILYGCANMRIYI